jgi:hypothetical protein
MMGDLLGDLLTLVNDPCETRQLRGFTEKVASALRESKGDGDRAQVARIDERTRPAFAERVARVSVAGLSYQAGCFQSVSIRERDAMTPPPTASSVFDWRRAHFRALDGST